MATNPNRGRFKPGHKKRGGRKRGTPNAFSAQYRKAILEAAYRIGMGGNGEQGVVGYLRFLARYHPRSFFVGLINILLWEFLKGDASAEEPRRTLEEFDESIREYIGLANDAERRSPWACSAQDFPVGELMQCAVEDPKAFCKLIIAAFLRPPTTRDRRARAV